MPYEGKRQITMSRISKTMWQAKVLIENVGSPNKTYGVKTQGRKEGTCELICTIWKICFWDGWPYKLGICKVSKSLIIYGHVQISFIIFIKRKIIRIFFISIIRSFYGSFTLGVPLSLKSDQMKQNVFGFNLFDKI